VIVANPASGRGRGARLIPKVEAVLRDLDVSHQMVVSRDGSEPERLARRAASEGATVVAALGGDGHVGAVANGLIGTAAALAVIPAGTGNDFSRGIGLDRKDPLAAVRLLEKPRTATVDVVRVRTPDRERFYVNVGGTGFDAEVNEHANGVSFLAGTPRYVYSTFVTLARFRPGLFRFTVDGEERSMSGMLVAVGNGVSYGGGMKVTPEARFDDGLLDLCVVGALSKPSFIRAFPRVFAGTHVTHPSVTMLRARRIEISADRAFHVYGDGERIGSLPATFEVVPAVLPVVMPGGEDDPGAP
jgi:diacylglycerol kinase (ATP)